MQVHLAQLEYELTRMRGKGLVMSRLGAGVDMRGPGETKMEVDRRVVRKRIQTLRQRIDQMARTRRTQRAKRVRTGRAARSRWPATPTPASPRCSTRSPTPRSRCATASSRRSTRRRATYRYRRPRLRGHRHGRLHPQAAAPARRRVRQHAGGDDAAPTSSCSSSDASVDEDELLSMTRAVDDVLHEIGVDEAPRLLVLAKADCIDAERRAELSHRHPGRCSSPQ